VVHNRGDGLSLAVAREVMFAHDGAIRVKSTEGQGATFSLSIPTCA